MIEKKDVTETVAILSSTLSALLIVAMFLVSVECSRLDAYIKAERDLRAEAKEAGK